jgi:hypothetical protein
VTYDDSGSNIDIWVDRVRRMVEYRAEATDFLRRASSILPAVDSDVELVCLLWTVADEHDVAICDALQRFDEELFEVPGQLEITRGAEPISTRDDREGLRYLCTWALFRSEEHSTSVVLAADRATGRFDLEVRDFDGSGRSIVFPPGNSSELYESLAHSFFALHGLSGAG